MRACPATRVARTTLLTMLQRASLEVALSESGGAFAGLVFNSQHSSFASAREKAACIRFVATAVRLAELATARRNV